MGDYFVRFASQSEKSLKGARRDSGEAASGSPPQVDFPRLRMSGVESQAAFADGRYLAGETPLSSTLPSGSDAPVPAIHVPTIGRLQSTDR